MSVILLILCFNIINIVCYMSKDFFKTIEVKVPNRSGEDLSFQHAFSGKCGSLIPAFWHEVIPGTRIYLKQALSASLPPLASDTYMRVRLKSEAFFVPFRQLSAAFAPWLTGEKIMDPADGSEMNAQIPQAVILNTANANCGPGSLADYLGYKISTSDTSNKPVNPFPFLAYHWIWDQMYRNSKIQRKAFTMPVMGSALNGAARRAGFIPYISAPYSFWVGRRTADECLSDGVYIDELRQRNFDADYFTTMTLEPQSVSTPAAVQFTVDSQGNGEFTIAALRAQNSLQQYLERQNLAGFRLTEWCKANYGVNLAEGMAQMPLFLGRSSIDVYSKGVDATSSYDSGNTTNPLAGAPGTRYGSAYALGNDTLIEEFEAKEPGIVMVLVSLVPKVTYATGVDPLLLHFTTQSSQGDIANPLLQNVGQQAVRQEQLSSNVSVVNNVFGYTDRYAEFMTKVDRASGLLRDGQSLDVFLLQRSFGSGQAVLSSSFLEIPTSYLDQVAAVSSSISNFGYWVDSFFEFKVSQPLAKYSIPSLQDPAYEHGKGVLIDRSGQVIN